MLLGTYWAGKALRGTCWPLLPLHVKELETLRILPEPGLHFHHHVILIQLCVHHRDLALPEGVVERVIDVLRGNAHASGGNAVDGQTGFEAAILLIAVHIGELRQRA